ncbi:unnamed protein product [Spirodela intermedia]|uniref:Cyclin-like domain-containing protein n=1 Tax=Spirodela intermedia TaxID=51605 RepID=A0A7I8JU33_SPIIN|nr:unnamed protein product [Spirodela intermedia]CAA6673251.1 unnamed protein product [Spirodela intermedia]
MAVFTSAESSYVTSENRHYGSFYEANEQDRSCSEWYFTRKEIEEHSPSRKDGIDLKKETYLRKSYCTFLQDLGMRLKVPQVTIATAIIFCHRFFLRQSHAKNDRRTIATVCMFLAGKVEETPHSLNNVILVSYDIIHKKDPAARQRIKQKEVYEQQKELILLGERVVLTTLGFDLNVHHPYRPLVEAIKKFRVAQNALAQVAWNFVNDGLRTSLCLQYKPHHIAAGAIFLAAKFLKVKLPSDGEKVWWQEFDVTPRQLEDVSNQMLELYEQNHTIQASHGSEVDGSTSNLTATRPPKAAASATNEDAASASSRPPPEAQRQTPNIEPRPNHPRDFCPSSHTVTTNTPPQPTSVNPGQQPEECPEALSGVSDHNLDSDSRDAHHPYHHRREVAEASSKPQPHAEADWEAAKGRCLPDAIKRIDKDKVKAALEKRKQSRGNLAKSATDLIDEDDLIERELESGVELAAKDERTQQETRRSWPKPPSSQRQGSEDHPGADKEKIGGGVFEDQQQQQSQGRQNPKSSDRERGALPDSSVDNAEEGELSSLDCQEPRHRPKPDRVTANGKRQLEVTQQRPDRPHISRDSTRDAWPEHVERDSKRPRHEAHV